MARIVQYIEGRAGETTQVTLSDTAAVLSSSIIVSGQKKAKRLILTVDSNDARVGMGGVTPTTAIGHLLDPGDVLVLEQKDNIEEAKFINAEAGVDAIIQVTAFF